MIETLAILVVVVVLWLIGRQLYEARKRREQAREQERLAYEAARRRIADHMVRRSLLPRIDPPIGVRATSRADAQAFLRQMDEDNRRARDTHRRHSRDESSAPIVLGSWDAPSESHAHHGHASFDGFSGGHSGGGGGGADFGGSHSGDSGGSDSGGSDGGGDGGGGGGD